MHVRAYRVRPSYILGCSALALVSFSEVAAAQVPLPEVVVSAPKQKPKPRPRNVQAAPPTAAPVTPAAQLNTKANAFDAARSNLYTTTGTTSDTITNATIDALPGGTNQTPARRFCCRHPACRKIPPPAASFTCATITPTCNFASTA